MKRIGIIVLGFSCCFAFLACGNSTTATTLVSTDSEISTTSSEETTTTSLETETLSTTPSETTSTTPFTTTTADLVARFQNWAAQYVDLATETGSIHVSSKANFSVKSSNPHWSYYFRTVRRTLDWDYPKEYFLRKTSVEDYSYSNTYWGSTYCLERVNGLPAVRFDPDHPRETYLLSEEEFAARFPDSLTFEDMLGFSFPEAFRFSFTSGNTFTAWFYNSTFGNETDLSALFTVFSPDEVTLADSGEQTSKVMVQFFNNTHLIVSLDLSGITIRFGSQTVVVDLEYDCDAIVGGTITEPHWGGYGMYAPSDPAAWEESLNDHYTIGPKEDNWIQMEMTAGVWFIGENLSEIYRIRVYDLEGNKIGETPVVVIPEDGTYFFDFSSVRLTIRSIATWLNLSEADVGTPGNLRFWESPLTGNTGDFINGRKYYLLGVWDEDVTLELTVDLSAPDFVIDIPSYNDYFSSDGLTLTYEVKAGVPALVILNAFANDPADFSISFRVVSDGGD